MQQLIETSFELNITATVSKIVKKATYMGNKPHYEKDWDLEYYQTL